MVTSHHSIHTIVRQSNRFWRAMFYDELIECEGCQLSFFGKADRLYYNAAHVLTRSDPDILRNIETEFFQRNIIPAIYWDAEAPKDLKLRLDASGYHLIHEETENWYGYSLTENRAKQLTPQKRIEIISFKPTKNEFFDHFMRINTSVNALTETLASRLKERFLTLYPDVDVSLLLAYFDGKPVATTALGIVDDFGFTAEVATLPEYRRNGLFLSLADAAANLAQGFGCRAMYVNCDAEAFSNQGYLRYGYQSIFTRYYYQKNEEGRS